MRGRRCLLGSVVSCWFNKCSTLSTYDPYRQCVTVIWLLHSSIPSPSTHTYSTCMCFLSHWNPSKQTLWLTCRFWSCKWVPQRVWWQSEASHQITSGQRSVIWVRDLYKWAKYLITASNTFLFVLKLSRVRVFPDPLENCFQMLRNIKNSAVLLELICSCWTCALQRLLLIFGR